MNPDTDTERAAEVDAALARLRAALDEHLGSEAPARLELDPAALPRFAADLPDEYGPDERAALLDRARALEPWVQGPFHLGGDVVIGGTARDGARWEGLGESVPADLSGRRVLDVGCGAGYDPFVFRLRGAHEILACEPSGRIEQARFLESVYRTGIDFQAIGWRELDARRHGTFDLIHCNCELNREPNPLAMLVRLRALLAEGGTMLLGATMLEDPELSEHARFIPGAWGGDPSWWWIPGRLAIRWMLEATGFEVRDAFGFEPGPSEGLRTMRGYFAADGGAPDPRVSAVTS